MTVLAEPKLTPRWLVLVLLFGIALLNFADRYLLAGLIGPIKAEFGLSDGFMGLLMGPAFALLYTVAAVPIARLADRTSRITVVCAGCIVWSLFTALTALSTNGWMLAAARVGVGIGEAAYQAPTAALIAAYFPPEKRTRALALVGSALYFGQMLGIAGGPAIAEDYSWHTPFWLLGGAGIVVAVTAWLVIREPARVRQAAAAQPPVAGLASRLTSTASVRNMALGMGLGTLSGVSFGLWGATLFERSYGLTNAEAGTAFAVSFGLPGLIGMILFGFLADRWARLGPDRPLKLSAMALFAATGCILLVTWMPTLGLAQLMAIPSGLLGGGWSIGIIAGLQYVLPERFRSTGTAMAVLVVGLFGNVLGPWIAGGLSDMFAGQAAGLRMALTLVIPTGFIGAWLLWRASAALDDDRLGLETHQT